MHSFHGNAAAEDSQLSAKTLELRIKREKRARSEAEQKLEEKSKELYEANMSLKLTASSLENQRLQLNTILDNTLAGICLVQGETEVVQANRAALEMFGLTHDDFSISDLFIDWTKALASIKDAIDREDGSEQVLREAEGKRANGDIFPIEFGLARMDHLGWDRSVWIFNDITRRKRAEEKRASLERELSQTHKMEALGTLASGVAHEINTPIQYVGDNMRFLTDSVSDFANLIGHYRDILQKIEDTGALGEEISKVRALEDKVDLEFLLEEASEAIEQSIEGTAQVASIVNAIKEFSHPGDDQKELVDLNKMIETTLTVTRNQWKYVAQVEQNFAPDLPHVECLPGEIGQVVLNLIVNAADAIASSDMEQSGLITITTSNLGDSIEIFVEDNGPGVPDDLVEKIFDPFFTTKDVGKGSGQGLAIAYTIITQKHAGQIHYVKNAKRAGFSIQLPIKATEIEGDES